MIIAHGRSPNVRNIDAHANLHEESGVSMTHTRAVRNSQRVVLEIYAGFDDDPEVFGPVVFDADAEIVVQPLRYSCSAKLIGSGPDPTNIELCHEIIPPP